MNASPANDSTLISYINENKKEPLDYLVSKLKDNDIVLLGERHNQNHQLEMLEDFIQRRSIELPPTILALEISTDEQNRVNHFLETGLGLEEIRFPSHLSNSLYRGLIVAAKESGLEIKCIDMPSRLFKHTEITRDEYMANTLIAKKEETHKEYKILAIVGCIHTIKTPIEWLTAGNSYKYLGLLLSMKDPTLNTFSICQALSSPDSDIDKSFSKFKECIACEVDKPFSLYHGGSLSLLNCKPINMLQAFDGVIYHPQ